MSAGVRQILALGTLVTTALLASGAQAAQVVYSAGPGLGLEIPDNDPGGLSDTIVVPDNGLIQAMAVLVQADHTWVGDLQFLLTGPSGLQVVLADRPGQPDQGDFGDNSNLSTTAPVVFADVSPLSAEAMGAACGGTDAIVGVDCPRFFAPQDSLLAAFAGTDMAGSWTLTLIDNAGADFGALDGWAVGFNFAEATVPVPGAFWLLGSALVGFAAWTRRR